jgi:hypothetical protein
MAKYSPSSRSPGTWEAHDDDVCFLCVFDARPRGHFIARISYRPMRERDRPALARFRPAETRTSHHRAGKSRSPACRFVVSFAGRRSDGDSS